jgi:hypothetical protein
MAATDRPPRSATRASSCQSQCLLRPCRERSTEPVRRLHAVPRGGDVTPLRFQHEGAVVELAAHCPRCRHLTLPRAGDVVAVLSERQRAGDDTQAPITACRRSFERRQACAAGRSGGAKQRASFRTRPHKKGASERSRRHGQPTAQCLNRQTGQHGVAIASASLRRMQTNRLRSSHASTLGQSRSTTPTRLRFACGFGVEC